MTSVEVESRTQEWRVRSEFRCGHTVREMVRSAAAECPLTPDGVGELLLAVTEVFNNAVEHAHRFDAERDILVRVQHLPDAIEVFVVDHGPGFQPAVLEAPEHVLPTQRGLGLFLASQLVDEISVTGNGGTTVRIVKRCPGLE